MIQLFNKNNNKEKIISNQHSWIKLTKKTNSSYNNIYKKTEKVEKQTNKLLNKPVLKLHYSCQSCSLLSSQ